MKHQKFTHSSIEQNENIRLHLPHYRLGSYLFKPISLSWPGKVRVKAIDVRDCYMYTNIDLYRMK